MKYTIEGFDQSKAVSLGIDAIDLILLRWIVDFWPITTKKRFRDDEYGWISFAYVIQELPVLNISNVEVIGRRFRGLASKGILKNHVERTENSRTYFAFGPVYPDLVRSKPATQKSEPGDSKVARPATQKSDYSSITDPSIKFIALPAAPPPLFEDPKPVNHVQAATLMADAPPILKVAGSDQKDEKRVAKQSEIRSFTDYYQSLFQTDYHGAKPTWDGKIMKLVKADIARLGGTLLKELAWLFFEYPPAFVEERVTGMGYNIFHSVLDSLLEKKRRFDSERDNERGPDHVSAHYG
jgi:hypothetical protein